MRKYGNIICALCCGRIFGQDACFDCMKTPAVLPEETNYIKETNNINNTEIQTADIQTGVIEDKQIAEQAANDNLPVAADNVNNSKPIKKPEQKPKPEQEPEQEPKPETKQKTIDKKNTGGPKARRKVQKTDCSCCDFCQNEGLSGRGLLYYKKWWKYNIVDIFIGGSCITGTPIFIDKNTMRVINDSYSYFVPLEKIDYIRTRDGLNLINKT